MNNIYQKIYPFITEGVNETPIKAKPDLFWQGLRQTGTELWLDTGDMDEALKYYTSEMTALTTNNTLVNKEIQKGIYDDFISEAKKMVQNLPLEQKIIEIAFILNARHGLRLAKKFGGFISVELHTNTAHDLDAIIEYGKRYHSICPNQFIIKIPYTATGLIGARKLKELGVKINFTLEFSARQNVLVAAFSKPDYLNVFLGRLGAYVGDNGLGNPEGVGEKAVIETQKWINKLTSTNKTPTKLIAASLRNAQQIDLLAGTNVFTMPTNVAAAAKTELSGNFQSGMDEDIKLKLKDEAEKYYIEKLWMVQEEEVTFGKSLDKNPPRSGDELIDRARNAGLEDMFPVLSENDLKIISEDGKIPVQKNWEERLQNQTIAIDTLLNLAGLASFTDDQKQLDERIKNIIQ